MKIFIAGPSGMIGTKVVEILLQKKHEIWALVHNPEQIDYFQSKGVHTIVGNAEENGSWLGQLPEEIDYTLNLIIPSLPTRLSLKQIENQYAQYIFNIGKNVLYAATKTKSKRMFQLADVHSYVNSGIEITERSPFNRDSADIGKIYTDMIPYLQNSKDTLVTLVMHGLIYNSEGQTKPEIPVLAGRLPIVGHGENFLSLIHAEDLATAIVFLLESDYQKPVINIVDDLPISQKEFIHLLAAKRQLGSAIVPAFLAPTVVGEVLSNTLSTSIQVKNQELKSLGYWLKYPTIKAGISQAQF